MATPRREHRLCRACRHDARHAPYGRPPGGGGILLGSAAPPLAADRRDEPVRHRSRAPQGRSPPDRRLAWLFKLMMRFVTERLGAAHVVMCAREERIWTFEWLRFQRTGIVARYAILGNVEHELLTMDLGNRLHDRGDLGLAEFLFDTEHPEIKLPAIQPGLGPTVETMGQSFLLAMSA